MLWTVLGVVAAGGVALFLLSAITHPGNWQ